MRTDGDVRCWLLHLRWYLGVVWIPFAALSVLAASEDPGQFRAYCEAEAFKPQCQDDEVVVVTWAMYGRMRLGSCVKTDYGFVGCKANVLPQLDEKCSGLHSCTVRVPDKTLKNACPDEFKTYLEAAWQCIRVDKAECVQCRTYGMVRLTSPEGRIASVVTREDKDNCGSSSCPWMLEAKPGQRFNVTLHDFGLAARGSHASPDVCYTYAVIHEQGREEKRVCGGRQRESTAYISEANKIEIRVVGHRSSAQGNFLLHYRVIGCPDLEPEHAWVKKLDKNKLEIGCDVTEDRWTVTCDGRRWIGEYGQCPTPSVTNPPSPNAMSLPLGVLIAIISAIALVIGVCILTIGLVCLKKHQHPPVLRYSQASYSQTPQEVEFKDVQPGLSEHQLRHYTTGPRNKRNMVQERPLPSVPFDQQDDGFVDESKYGKHLYQVTQYGGQQVPMLPMGQVRQVRDENGQVRLLTQRQVSCPGPRPPQAPRAGTSRQHSHDPQYFVLDPDEVRIESVPTTHAQEAAALRALELRKRLALSNAYEAESHMTTKPLLPTESEEDLAEAQVRAQLAGRHSPEDDNAENEDRQNRSTSELAPQAVGHIHCPSCQHGTPCGEEENKQTCSWP